MTPIGGGVSIEPLKALEASALLTDEEGRVRAARAAVDIKALPADRWWWD